MAERFSRQAQFGGLLVVAAVVGFAIALFDYFSPGNGIDHTGGALLVVLASAALAIAGLFTYPDRIGIGWLHSILVVLILLGIIGTGFAAYMLEAYFVLIAMIVALVGWIMAVLAGGTRTRTTRATT